MPLLHTCTGLHCSRCAPLPGGFGTCEVCETTCTTVHLAYDEEMVEHYFCTGCRDSGAAIAWLEEQAG